MNLTHRIMPSAALQPYVAYYWFFKTDHSSVAMNILPTWHSKWMFYRGKSMIVDGVGGVISFVPVIAVLFFFLSLLEDGGYMARIAFVMDRLLRKLGLSGRSIVPLLVGFGCSVPAVMATRTLPSERDRRMTIMLIPFMSCSAKVPIYAFFTAAFFPRNGALVMIGLYLFGVCMAILTALQNKFKAPSATNIKGDDIACGGNCAGCTGHACSANHMAIAEQKAKEALEMQEKLKAENA